jgi:hypothetical protein
MLLDLHGFWTFMSFGRLSNACDYVYVGMVFDLCAKLH